MATVSLQSLGSSRQEKLHCFVRLFVLSAVFKFVEYCDVIGNYVIDLQIFCIQNLKSNVKGNRVGALNMEGS